jgi:5'-3' exoribonuclease 1
MGIPYYFYHLTKKYKNIVNYTAPSNINIYAIDFNGIIHPEAAKETNQDKLFLNLWNKIKNYDEIYKPVKLYICIDGVAPFAKIIQQRKRRYLTIFRNKLDKIKSEWDTNAISTGTTFMNSLDNYLNSKINEEIKTTYFLDGSINNGEGEHKIFTHLNSNLTTDNIIINGLDADLIILSLISGISNIYLMRENNDEIMYLNINNLKEALLSELRIKWTNLNDIDIIESYCVMCSILGNDFIPHIPTLNMKNNGLNTLIDFTTIAIKETGSLVSENKINKNCLTYIFNLISKDEDTQLFIEVSKFIEKRPTNMTTLSSEYGLKNKDKLTYDIYNNNKKWRYYYYKSLFDININYDSSLVSSVVSSFIKGIYWTYNYYKKFDLDYEWFYPYNFPPTSKDISNYLKVTSNIPDITNNGTFLSSKYQLLLILPIQSNHLLNFDEDLKSLTIDSKKGFTYLFPQEFKIQTFLKTQLHECFPILPMIDIYKIKNINQ